MNNYEEALEEVLENGGYLDGGKDDYKAPKLLREAIQKAEKYDELELNGDVTYIESKIDRHNSFVKLQKECDEALKRIAELEDKCNMHDFFWEGCGFDKLGFKNSIQIKEYIDKLRTENKVFKNGIKSLTILDDSIVSEADRFVVLNDALYPDENGYAEVKAMLEVVEDE